MRNKIFKLVSFVIILLGVPIGVFLVSKATRYKSLAVVEPVDVYFALASQTLPPDSVFRVMANARSNSVVFSKVVLTFDKSIINLESEITLTPLMGTVIRKSTRADANANGRVEIVLAVPPSQTPPTGIYEIASFSVGQVNDAVPGKASFDFVNNQMQFVNINSEATVLQTTSSSIDIPVLPTQTATPTITPSPTLAPTAAPTPTLAATPTPSPLPTTTPSLSPTPSPLPTSSTPGCTVSLNPSPVSVGYQATVALNAAVTAQGGATISRVIFGSSNTSVASVSPIQDYSYPYQTVLTGNSAGTATVTARVYIIGRSTVACQATSTVNVSSSF